MFALLKPEQHRAYIRRQRAEVTVTSPHRIRSARAEQTTEHFHSRSARYPHFSTRVDCFVDSALEWRTE
jgi:hypothetical protein